jgi:sulfate adenylyltransferase
MVMQPHGGTLINRLLSAEEAADWGARAPILPTLTLGRRELLDLNLLGIGAFSPLTGYMTGPDYRSVVQSMHLANGIAWSMPIVLPVSKAFADPLRDGQTVLLKDDQNRSIGLLDLQERFSYDRALEASEVYRTEDAAHPGVAALYQQGEVLLGGPIRLFAVAQSDFPEHPHTPQQARDVFTSRGWNTVVAFQTRNPVHRAHEYIQKCALETVDGLFLHPLVGETKSDDIPPGVRMRCYETLLESYYPTDRVLLGTYPARMRYAGPREAIFHALARKNYGCTHFIVGRDHAGVGKYYGTYDAQRIFSEFRPEELGIAPIFFENTFYCRQCQGMASSKTCPHDAASHVDLSGTQVRALLQSGQTPPPEFSRPEVAAVLVRAMSGAAVHA